MFIFQAKTSRTQAQNLSETGPPHPPENNIEVGRRRLGQAPKTFPGAEQRYSCKHRQASAVLCHSSYGQYSKYYGRWTKLQDVHTV